MEADHRAQQGSGIHLAKLLLTRSSFAVSDINGCSSSWLTSLAHPLDGREIAHLDALSPGL
jgi:hypothetical protein